MLTFLEPTCTRPTLPDVVLVDGQPYVRRELTARAVRPGDLTAVVDMTHAQHGTYGIGTVRDAWSNPVGSGRRYVAPWRRRTIVTRGYRGTLYSFQAPHPQQDYAHDDVVTVWRLAARVPAGARRVVSFADLPECQRYVRDGVYIPA